MTEHTDELLEGILLAIVARDFDAVAGLLRRLAAQAPAKAQDVLDAIGIAGVIANRRS